MKLALTNWGEGKISMEISFTLTEIAGKGTYTVSKLFPTPEPADEDEEEKGDEQQDNTTAVTLEDPAKGTELEEDDAEDKD